MLFPCFKIRAHIQKKMLCKIKSGDKPKIAPLHQAFFLTTRNNFCKMRIFYKQEDQKDLLFFWLKYILQNTCMLNNAHKILYSQSIQVKCFELYTRFPQQFFFISLNCYIVPSKIIIVIYIWNGYFIYNFFLSSVDDTLKHHQLQQLQLQKYQNSYLGLPPALISVTASPHHITPKTTSDWIGNSGEKFCFLFSKNCLHYVFNDKSTISDLVFIIYGFCVLNVFSLQYV